jgi:hypothetical protein
VQSCALFPSNFCYHPPVKSRGNGIYRLRVALCAVAIVALTSRAGAATPDVVIDCPALSSEQRSSLEARARAELAMNRLSESQIQINCVSPLVLVTYGANGVPIRSSSASLVQDINQWVEEILTLIHVVIAPSVDLTDNATAAPASGEPSPPVASVAASEMPSATLPATPNEFSFDASRRRPTSLSTFVGGGLCSELWAKPANAFAGPCASVGLHLSSFWRIAATGATEWSAAKPDNIAIHLWQAGAEARFGRAFWFALGMQLSAFSLVPDNGFLPRSKFAYQPTFALRGGLSTSLGGHRLVTGAGIRIYSMSRDVRLNNRTVFQIPMLALTLGIEYQFDL